MIEVQERNKNMIEETRERKIPKKIIPEHYETYKVFIAFDGEEFRDLNSCELYEQRLFNDKIRANQKRFKTIVIPLSFFDGTFEGHEWRYISNEDELKFVEYDYGCELRDKQFRRNVYLNEKSYSVNNKLKVGDWCICASLNDDTTIYTLDYVLWNMKSFITDAENKVSILMQELFEIPDEHE